MAMEVSGAKTLLEFLLSKGIQVDTFATDRSSSIRWNIIGINHGISNSLKLIRTLMSREYKDISHQFDPWHFIKVMYETLVGLCMTIINGFIFVDF